MTDSYGEPEHTVELAAASAVWFYSTWFVPRWQMEGTFEKARARLGGETQRQWCVKAIECTTPTSLALYACVVVLAD